jgi:hypothetical protein
MQYRERTSAAAALNGAPLDSSRDGHADPRKRRSVASMILSRASSSASLGLASASARAYSGVCSKAGIRWASYAEVFEALLSRRR